MSKKSVSCLTFVCIFLICSHLFADAGSAFRAIRKVELTENSTAPVTRVPIKFGDENESIIVPPGPAALIEPKLIQSKSSFILPDKTWQPEKFTGTRHVYVQLDPSNPRSGPSLLEENGVTVKKVMRNCMYVIETDFEGIEYLRKSKHVIGVEPILGDDKMTENVYREDFGTWATEANSDVRLIVSFFDGTSYQKAKQIVSLIGGTMLSPRMVFGNKALVRIAPINIASLADSDVVQYISQVGPPSEPGSVESGIVSNVFWWDTYPDTYTGLFESPYSYAGQGIKVGVRDEGGAFEHTKFDTPSRITVIDTYSQPSATHAMNVTGIIGASEFNDTQSGARGRGMASEADLFIYTKEKDEPSEVADILDGLDNYEIGIFNISLKREVSLAGDSEHSLDYFGLYSTVTEDYDEIVYDNYDKFLSLMKCASNDRWDGFYYSEHPITYYPNGHEGVEAGDSEAYHCIPDGSCAKNIVTIGAVTWDDNNTDGIVDINDSETSELSLSIWGVLPHPAVYRTTGSSSGPTDDGRIKPDVVALGTNQWTTSHVYEEDTPPYFFDSYRSFGGTSGATPVVTGIVALIHEAYDEVYGEWPTADVVKGLLCNTAVDLGRVGPDYLYGWGLANAVGAIDVVLNDAEGLSADGGYIAGGIVEHYDDEVTFQVEIDGTNDTSDMKVMLVWVDPEGDPNATFALINDLDLEVINPDGEEAGTTYYPWVMQCEPDPDPEDGFDSMTWTPHLPALQSTFSAGGDPGVRNVLDNIEQVVIVADTTTALDTGTWTVKVRGSLISSDYQPFAIVTNKGFSGVSFLNCKVFDLDMWLTPRNYLPDVTPDLRFAVFSKDGIGVEDGDNPPQYRYSTNGGSTWTSWANLGTSGACYADAECSTTLDGSDTHAGVTYIRINAIPFNQSSYDDNMIQIKVYQGGYTEQEYTIPVGDEAYVDAADGNDTQGTGSMSYPWKTAVYALSKISADADHPFTVKLRGDTDSIMDYGRVEMEDYVSIIGGHDASYEWKRRSGYNSHIFADANDTSAVIAASNCTLKDVIVKNASTCEGIYIDQETNFVVDECVIEANDTGIYVTDSDTITISASSIVGDTTAGIYIYNTGGTTMISGCTFDGDMKKSTSIDSCSPVIVNCLFKDNAADTSSAIEITGAASPEIVNCTIVKQDGAAASGIQVISNDGGTPALVNSILWDNADDIKLDDPDNGDTISIIYSNIEDGDGPANAGNISSEPDFRDTDTFRIKYCSPCREAGIDTADNVPEADMYGNARPWDEKIDMGAHEYRLEISSITYHSEATEDTVTIEWDDEVNSLTCDIYYHGDMTDTIGYWTLADTEQLSPWVDDNDVADSDVRFYIINKH
jgi:subtilase family protein/parallel beta helix pectate lyase-like protein